MLTQRLLENYQVYNYDLPANILTQRSLENYQVYNSDHPADILTQRLLENYQVYNYDLPPNNLTQRSLETYQVYNSHLKADILTQVHKQLWTTSWYSLLCGFQVCQKKLLSYISGYYWLIIFLWILILFIFRELMSI